MSSSSSSLSLSLSSSSSSLTEDDDQSILQQALHRSEERALDNFVEQEAPLWIQERSTLPFSCTACGRCCQTKGTVYMDPEELQKASQLLELTPYEFAQKYASHILGPDAFDETATWIRLREMNGSCVFLGDDGKLCTIYEARPVQCRVYPFWPRIMKSTQSWDNECRRSDDDPTSPLPPWTRQEGGCEGMQTLSKANDIDDNDDHAVTVREAYRQLYAYIVSDKRFPKGTERPLSSLDEPG